MQSKLLIKQNKLLLFQDMHWKIKVKSNHLSVSDANTSYYHACATIRRNRNLINSIKDDQRNIITHPIKIVECITKAFQQRFQYNRDYNHKDFELLEKIIFEGR